MKALRDKLDLFGSFHPNHAGLICREFMGPLMSMGNPLDPGRKSEPRRHFSS
jgi:hypothetical protein